MPDALTPIGAALLIAVVARPVFLVLVMAVDWWINKRKETK